MQFFEEEEDSDAGLERAGDNDDEEEVDDEEWVEVEDGEDDEESDLAAVFAKMGQGTPQRHLGDLVISYDTAKRQAAERGHSIHDEMRVLLVHGLLHLLGHDHEEEEEAARMRAAELRALEELRWGTKGLISSAQDDGLGTLEPPQRVSPR